MDKKYIRKSIIMNSIIVIMVVVASIIMFTGIRFMPGNVLLETTKIGMFKFFTVDSNMFMGIISLIFLIEEIKLLKGKINNISNKLYILKLMSTVSVSITFIVVFLYLGPISEGGIYSMLLNSNLFFHLLIPLFSIITFIFFENTNIIKKSNIYMGSIPTLVYGILYLINILIHMKNGKVDKIYDFYWFCQYGSLMTFIIFSVIMFISYMSSFLLWKINNRKRY